MFNKKLFLRIILLIGVILIISVTIIVAVQKNIVPSKHKITINSSSSSRPLTFVIKDYLEKGEFKEASEEALNYIKENPNSPIALAYLGITDFQIGKYQKSITDFKSSLSKRGLPTSTRARINYLLGRDYFVLKNYKSAILYYNKAIELFPGSYQAYDGLGIIALKNKNYEKAITLFNKEISIIPNGSHNPLSGFPYYGLAKAYFNLGDYNKAKTAIYTAKELVGKLTNPGLPGLERSIHDLEIQIEAKLKD